jgi:hypothetical protein
VPKTSEGFRLYVAAQEHVIGAVLIQKEGDKEFAVAYLSRRLIGGETRCTSIEK